MVKRTIDGASKRPVNASAANAVIIKAWHEIWKYRRTTVNSSGTGELLRPPHSNWGAPPRTISARAPDSAELNREPLENSLSHFANHQIQATVRCRHE